MSNTIVTTGAVTGERTLTLDQPLPNSSGRVKVTVEFLEVDERPPILKVLDEIHEAQRRRGHVPRTKEQIDADLAEERAGWDD